MVKVIDLCARTCVVGKSARNFAVGEITGTHCSEYKCLLLMEADTVKYSGNERP